jgi:hypothetical protein
MESTTFVIEESELETEVIAKKDAQYKIPSEKITELIDLCMLRDKELENSDSEKIHLFRLKYALSYYLYNCILSDENL